MTHVILSHEYEWRRCRINKVPASEMGSSYEPQKTKKKTMGKNQAAKISNRLFLINLDRKFCLLRVYFIIKSYNFFHYIFNFGRSGCFNNKTFDVLPT